MRIERFRNVAIIAHVDHGKTTLVDGLLKQAGVFRENQYVPDCVMDRNALERERGITILAKNCAIEWKGVKVNIIDTPGHADFGGEVERVLQMAEGVLLLVDAADGPMPQTRFVLRKALALKLRPVVVVNKIDRPDARPAEAAKEVEDLFLELGADFSLLDFPVVYASGREGFAVRALDDPRQDLRPLFETILEAIPPPEGEPGAPGRLQVANLDHSDYLGRIVIGRVRDGTVRRGAAAWLLSPGAGSVQGRVDALFTFTGIGRTETEEAVAGDIVAISGFEEANIGDTVALREDLAAFPPAPVDAPTLTMIFRVNDSPFAGREGTYVTARHLRERLFKEARVNVALRVRETDTPDAFRVDGRGLLHLSVLIETMRREGYELQVTPPRVIEREGPSGREEPIESVTVDVPEHALGKVMALMGTRRAELSHMNQKGAMVHLEFQAPSRGLIGLRQKLLTATRGEAVLHHTFLKYAPWQGPIPRRQTGAQVAAETGRITAYALQNLRDRGPFFVEPGEEVYQGQVVGEHVNDRDITVNACKAKHLTNVRSSTKELIEKLDSAVKMSLEEALEYVEDDELVETTPKSIRIRKAVLNEKARLREHRARTEGDAKAAAQAKAEEAARADAEAKAAAAARPPAAS